MNVTDFINKLLSLYQAVENDPTLLAAVMAVVGLFHPAVTPAQAKAVPQQAEQMTTLREAFDNSTGVHQVMQANGLAVSGSSLGDLFNEFLKLLPLIAQVLAMLGKSTT